MGSHIQLCLLNSSIITSAQPEALPGAAAADDYDDAGIITPGAYLRHAQDWVRSGASIVGGCCGVGPAHISLLAQHLAGKPAS